MLTPHFFFWNARYPYLRSFQRTPGTYPRLSTNTLWRNFFHLGCLRIPGVCSRSMLGFLVGESPPRKLITKALKRGTWYFSPTKQLQIKKVEVYLREKWKAPGWVLSMHFPVGKKQKLPGKWSLSLEKTCLPQKMIWRLHDILAWNSHWMCWLIRGWLIKSRFQN